jgi:sec-independent protein translocase protein TatA
MFGLGMQELIIILLIVVVVFGSTRLPQVGEGMGKMITNFRKSMKGLEKGEDQEKDEAAPDKKEIPPA